MSGAFCGRVDFWEDNPTILWVADGLDEMEPTNVKYQNVYYEEYNPDDKIERDIWIPRGFG